MRRGTLYMQTGKLRPRWRLYGAEEGERMIHLGTLYSEADANAALDRWIKHGEKPAAADRGLPFGYVKRHGTVEMPESGQRRAYISRVVVSKTLGTVRFIVRGERLENGSRAHLGSFETRAEAETARDKYIATGELPANAPKGRKPCVVLDDGSRSFDPEVIARVKAERRALDRPAARNREAAYRERKRAARPPKPAKPAKLEIVKKPATPRNERPYATTADWKRLWEERFAA